MKEMITVSIGFWNIFGVFLRHTVQDFFSQLLQMQKSLYDYDGGDSSARVCSDIIALPSFTFIFFLCSKNDYFLKESSLNS